jgi:hypothetical protein
MIEIVEKIAVNSRIITSVPGKKYSIKLAPPGELDLKLRPIPAPMSTQNTIDNPIPLPHEPHQFALTQRRRWQDQAGEDGG